MSIVINQYPSGYLAGYSPQIFAAQSNQTGQPNFSYTIVCTDLISGDTQTYQRPARPDGDVTFDAKPFSELFLDHYIPINEYGWKAATGVRKIRVNIGETYGTTPTYASGANYDFIIWNGILDWKEYPVYDPANYVYDSDTPNVKYLNEGVDEFTYSGRSNYLYSLTSKADDIYEIEIKTYDASGNLLGTSTIDNPNKASTNYQEKYLCIDIGHKGLSSIASGDVGGTFPIITNDVSYYDVRDVYDNGFDFIFTPIKRYYIGCAGMYDVYTVHYLRQNGAFQTLNFSKKSSRVLNNQSENYSTLPFVYSGTEYTYSPSARVKKVLSSERTEVLTLNTDWLSEEEVDYYKDILDSPIIYFDFGSSEDYLQVILNVNSYKLNKRYNEKLYSITMDFTYAHSNVRQNG